MNTEKYIAIKIKNLRNLKRGGSLSYEIDKDSCEK
jgi:hypothetical protein